MKTLACALIFALTLCAGGSATRAPAHAHEGFQREPSPDGVRLLLQQLEQVLQAGDADRFSALLAASADPTMAQNFAAGELQSGVTRAVVQERDRLPLQGTLPGNGYRLLVDTFIEVGPKARVVTWRLDVRRAGEGQPWRIGDQERITGVESLYRLALHPAKQFDARDLRITAEDLELTLHEGSVFVAETDQGITGLVLLGNGTMRFHPAPETEKGQVKIFCGSETLESRFNSAFIRVNPYDFDTRIDATRLTARPVDASAWRRADAVLRDESPKSFGLDLADLSRDPWSLLPSSGDFLAEVRTRRFDTLTYARAGTEAEDITVFDRKRHKNISVYTSAQKLARRGAFYNEDELADYDVLDYNIDVTFSPDRMWLEGRARLRLRVRSAVLGTLTLRLAEPLAVQSIASDRFGRLFGVRVRNQNSIVVNLPGIVLRDTDITLTVAYNGRLEPQSADRETVMVQRSAAQEDQPLSIPLEPTYLYSNRSLWYPQAGVTDYATATIRITLPASLDCIASGDPDVGSPLVLSSSDSSRAQKIYSFTATQPVRYLAFLATRLARGASTTVDLGRENVLAGDTPLAGVSYNSLNVTVAGHPRQAGRGRDFAERTADIVRLYSSLVGDTPYPSFTLALIEGERPGGHSPAYFAQVLQPMPNSPFSFRNDPEVFTAFPEFYLAHELAHQWWGQAVGWRNYHEQWISEGFAQYFAALYAQRRRGDDVFASVMRQLRKWGMDMSPQGPVYLGYRLGHIRSESRVFNALVYNKSAAVLHMLRRLVGDDAFFRGVRRFYRESRFKKAGTEDFRKAMEAEAQRPLTRFFARWIYGSTLPKLKLSYRLEPGEQGAAGAVLLHLEQVGEIFDIPVTLTLQFATGKDMDVVVPVTEASADMRVRLPGPLRGVELSKDDGTLAEIVRP